MTNRLYQLIRDFATKTQPWEQAIRYQTKPDERHDITLTCSRVYRNREDFIVIMAAANMESVEDEMPEQLLTLPLPEQLRAMKRVASGA